MYLTMLQNWYIWSGQGSNGCYTGASGIGGGGGAQLQSSTAGQSPRQEVMWKPLPGTSPPIHDDIYVDNADNADIYADNEDGQAGWPGGRWWRVSEPQPTKATARPTPALKVIVVSLLCARKDVPW